MAKPSINEQENIIDWCLANADGLRVYEDGWVSCDILAYNLVNLTTWDTDFFIPVYFFDTYNASRKPFAGFNFLQFWGMNRATNTARAVLVDDQRVTPGHGSARYVIVSNLELPIDYRFNRCYFNYLYRLGDACGFDPSDDCCDSTIMALNNTFLAATTFDDGSASIPATQLLKINGNQPGTGDTITFSLYQGSQLITEGVYNAGADIDFAADAPASETTNTTFTRPDQQTVSFTNFATAIQPYLSGCTFTNASGLFQMEKFLKRDWALEFSVYVGPMDGYALPEFHVDKTLFVKVADGASGSVSTYVFAIQKSEIYYGWPYVPGFDVQIDDSDQFMSVVVAPDGGVYIGNIFNDIDRFQPLVAGNISSSTARLGAGVYKRQAAAGTISYWWSCSMDPNYTPKNASNVDTMVQFLLCCPRAWAGTQTANDRFVLFTPSGTNQDNAIGSWSVNLITPDAGSPDTQVVNAFFDGVGFTTNGQTNIWASDVAGDFYLMTFSAGLWSKASPASWSDAVLTAGILKNISFGVTVGGNDWMLVEWRNTSAAYETREVWYYEHTGGGNRDDRTNWTGQSVYATAATADLIGGMWDHGDENDSAPIFYAIRAGSGQIWEYKRTAGVWGATQISPAGGFPTLEEVTFVKKLETIRTGPEEANTSILVAGREGYNSAGVCLWMYDIDGNPVSLIQKGSRLRDGGGFALNMIY